ncbi:hypothetical protein [Methylobacterium sp. WSM2598]|uniref:hypothetical protein n=1 Tax=Methylobacterium sp. WSM2598 TaxID=398261 RepID=UPI0012F62F3E|nr:hypothetical protein [Methylobacterium sp. WSM2598]
MSSSRMRGYIKDYYTVNRQKKHISSDDNEILSRLENILAQASLRTPIDEAKLPAKRCDIERIIVEKLHQAAGDSGSETRLIRIFIALGRFTKDAGDKTKLEELFSVRGGIDAVYGIVSAVNYEKKLCTVVRQQTDKYKTRLITLGYGRYVR